MHDQHLSPPSAHWSSPPRRGAPRPLTRGRPLSRILDTTPTFEEFASKAFLKDPSLREELWRDVYEGAHPEVFAVLDERFGKEERIPKLVREASKLRRLAKEAAPEVRQAIEEVEPQVREVLDVDPGSSPQHVLLIGRMGANAFVDRLGEDVAVFHCLEWHTGLDGARVLVAHEDTHAWHRLVLDDDPPEDDLAWMAFWEGIALQVSREVCDDRSEYDQFWYGFPGFEHWLPWCQDHRDELRERFRDALDDEDAVDTWFGGGQIDQQLRVGFFLADELVAGLDRPPSELVTLSVDEGRNLIREALGAG